ncbi:hypothetical protein Tco_0201873 [Tanacetum coccineum]
MGSNWKVYSTPSTTKVDSEPPNGSNADITNQYESAQTLDVSAGTSNLSAGTSFNPKKEELRFKPQTSMSNDVCSQQFRPQTSMSNDVCSQQFRPQTSMSNDVCSQQFRPQTSMSNDV